MGCAYHSIKVNDCEWRVPFNIEVRFYSPHPCIEVWLLTNLGEPMHKSAWVSLAIIHECKDELDSCYVKPTHSENIGIGDNEGGIIMRYMKFAPL